MNSQELYDRFRSDVVDAARPYLWSDDEVWSYADDAYRMFVRLTGGIADFTSSVTQIALSVGTDIYEMDKSILRIMSASLDDGSDVQVVNAADIPNLYRSGADYGPLRTLSTKNVPGAVRWMVTGMQRGTVKVIQIPVVADTISMHVYRLPLVHVTDGTHELTDIESDHHVHLLKWMKAMAYQKQDAETFDKTKSESVEAAFRNYCTQCKAEWDRYKTKVRTVAYGGI